MNQKSTIKHNKKDKNFKKQSAECYQRYSKNYGQSNAGMDGKNLDHNHSRDSQESRKTRIEESSDLGDNVHDDEESRYSASSKTHSIKHNAKNNKSLSLSKRNANFEEGSTSQRHILSRNERSSQESLFRRTGNLKYYLWSSSK